MLSDIQLTIMLNSGCRRFGIVLQSNVNISTDISLLKWQTSLKTHHRRFYMFILFTHKSMYFHRKNVFLFIAEASIIYYHSKSFAFNIRFKIQKWILYQKLLMNPSLQCFCSNIQTVYMHTVICFFSHIQIHKILSQFE